MRTCIDIDDRLMRQAMRRSKSSTKKAAVEAGLRLLVDTCSQISIRGLRGKMPWNRDLNRLRQGPGSLAPRTQSRSGKAQEATLMARRDAFAELMEGAEAMGTHRNGKVALRSHKVDARSHKVDSTLVRGRMRQ